MANLFKKKDYLIHLQTRAIRSLLMAGECLPNLVGLYKQSGD